MKESDYQQLKDNSNKISGDELEFLEHSNYIENERSPEAMEDAIRAWIWAYKRKINFDNILVIHRILMKRLRPDIAGKLRDCDVFIGGHRKIFVSQALLKDEVRQWVTKIRAKLVDNKWDTLQLHAQNCHVAFEQIHPFQDGNGRVGRILYNLQRIRAGLPIHIIHEGSEQRAYYEWFNS